MRASCSEQLFGSMRMNQADLPAANIHRGREEGVADYNAVRKAFQLPPLGDLAEINPQLFAREPEVSQHHVSRNLTRYL